LYEDTLIFSPVRYVEKSLIVGEFHSFFTAKQIKYKSLSTPNHVIIIYCNYINLMLILDIKLKTRKISYTHIASSWFWAYNCKKTHKSHQTW